MKFVVLLTSILLAGLVRGQNSPVPLGDGESLTYRVRWGIFNNAGEITISAKAEEMVGLPEIRIMTHTNTRGIVRGLYLFDGDGESVFDERDGRLLMISAWSSSSKKVTKTMAVFDYAKSLVNYVDYMRPERSGAVKLPPGNTMDLITSLIETRRWDMKPGERSPATVIFEKEFYDIILVADSIEHIRTPLGEFNALVLHPIMEGQQRGIFKRGGHVRVWISQDARHLPVQFEVGMKFGTGTAMLSAYTPPTAKEQVADAHFVP